MQSYAARRRENSLKLWLLLTAGLLFPALALGQQSQTITFTQPSPPSAFAGTSVLLTATATSGLPVAFSVISGPAQATGANGSTLTFTGVGTVIVQADQAGGGGYSPAPSVQAPAVNVLLLTEPVTTQSSSVTTILTISTAGTLAQISALTQGAVNLDFLSAATFATPGLNPCTAGVAYTVGQTCSLSFTFKPTRPGIRYGGLTLTDAQGNLLANSYIYGYGVGPQVLYQPIVQTLVGSSLGAPSGVAINGRGDLFVSNNVGSGLTEIAVDGTVTAIGNFTLGKDVAVDGSGNVFLITYDTLYEITAVQGAIPASPVVRTLATGFTVDGGGLAIAGNGNAYIANSPAASRKSNPTGVVYEVDAIGGVIPSNSTKQTIGPLFAEATGAAVDSSGNVYVSDGSAPGIFEMLAVDGRIPASPAVVTLGKGSIAPSNIRLDDTNDIFISDSGFPGILEYPAVNGIVDPATLPKSIGSGFISPQGLLVDGSGNVFVADRGFSQVVKLNYSTVPSLQFQPTLLGNTSADSPQAVTYTNAGNAPLIFTPPFAGANPAITPGFTLGAASTCPQLAPGGAPGTLAVGQTCTDLVSFTPLATGPLTGTLTTVDNDLSVPGATQVIPLNGNGLLTPPVIQFTIANHFVDDPPFQVAASSTSPALLAYTVASGPATLAGSTITLTGVPGTVTLLASQPEKQPFAAATATATFSVIKHPQTIGFAALVTPVLIASSPVTLLATASSGLPVTFRILSGPGSITGNRLTLNGFGPITVAADQAGNALYDPAPEVVQQIVVLDNRLTLTLSATPNPVFLSNPVLLNVVVSSPGGMPTGSALFLDGAVALATVPLNGGAASFTTSSLTLGTHAITVVYSGDGVFAGTTGAPLSILVEDFSLTIDNPQLTIPHGGTAVYHLTLAPVGGTAMAAPISFAMSGNPDHSPVIFSPAQAATGSGTTQVTLTIQTPDYPVGPFAKSSGGRVPIPILAVSLGLLFGLRRRLRRSSLQSLRLSGVLFAFLLSVAVLSLAGCGWSAQPYTMTITASSGTLSHSVGGHLISQ